MEEDNRVKQTTERKADPYVFPFPGFLIFSYGGQHIRSLLSSHHWDTRVWPHEQESGTTEDS